MDDSMPLFEPIEPSLSTIPTELLFMIADYLDITNLSTLALASKRHKAVYVRELRRRDALRGKGLIYGATTGQIRTMELALDYGTDINILSTILPVYNRFDNKPKLPGQGTALHAAVIHGQIEAIDWLMNKGASSTIPSNGPICSCIPIHKPEGHQCSRTNGSNPNIDEHGNHKWYPIHLALCRRQPAAFEKLIKQGVELVQFAPCQCGRVSASILHRAVMLGQVESMKFLLENRDTEHMVNEVVESVTPIDQLCTSRHSSVTEVRLGIKTLLEHGSQCVNLSTMEKLVTYGALDGAPCSHFHKAADILELGAYHPELLTTEALTDMLTKVLDHLEFDQVQCHSDHDSTEYETEKGRDYRHHRYRLVKQLLQKGAKLPESSLIHICKKTATWDIADLIPLFMEFDSSIDINEQDSEGMTALHHLVTRTKLHWTAGTKYGFDFEYNPENYPEPDGPIMNSRPATLQYFKEAIEALMARGARLDTKTGNHEGLGRTPGRTPIDQVNATWTNIKRQLKDHRAFKPSPWTRGTLWRLVAIQAMLGGISPSNKSNILPPVVLSEKINLVSCLRRELGLGVNDLPLMIDGKVIKFRVPERIAEDSYTLIWSDEDENWFWRGFLQGGGREKRQWWTWRNDSKERRYYCECGQSRDCGLRRGYFPLRDRDELPVEEQGDRDVGGGDW
ncbi:ankyrin repeat-containing domain protein [Podospora fimiseda]|uniref:Ankyrin repeat-containing domain protein n=1 Tax=Podospora fimiseda TaxID=252190 RepID=A0AAN7GXL4_9PEZI|nr:ankyrin repeat-containing domain protein [Podospora fimiseda]